MAGIDLSSVKDFNDGLMKDEIIVYVPQDGDEGTWNEATGTYDRQPPLVRYSGKCQFWSSKQGIFTPEEASVFENVNTYFFEVPLEAEELQPEDVIRVLVVNEQGNQQMLFKELLVKSKDFYSYSVSQIVKAELREAQPS